MAMASRSGAKTTTSAMKTGKARIALRNLLHVCMGSNNQNSLGNGRKLYHNRQYEVHFGLASDVEATDYTNDDAGMKNLSVFNNVEGAQNNINSLLNDGILVGDFDIADDTSFSSRASSRFFDSEPILILETYTNPSASGIGSCIKIFISHCID